MFQAQMKALARGQTLDRLPRLQWLAVRPLGVDAGGRRFYASLTNTIHFVGVSLLMTIP